MLLIYFDIVKREESQALAVGHVIVCAGQVPFNPLAAALSDAGQMVHVIGGALDASESKRAIKQASHLVAEI